MTPHGERPRRRVKKTAWRPADRQNPQARELTRTRTRDAILAAAISLYKREGYGAVTMRAIANQLGFSAPAIYNYFISKEEIFIALQEIGFRLMREAVIEPATDDALADLRSIFTNYYDFAKTQPEYFTLLYVDPSAPRVNQEFADLRAMSEATAVRVHRCINEGIFPEGTPPPVTALLWGSVHGPAVLRMVQAVAPGTDFDHAAKAGLDVMIAGIRAGFVEKLNLA